LAQIFCEHREPLSDSETDNIRETVIQLKQGSNQNEESQGRVGQIGPELGGQIDGGDELEPQTREISNGDPRVAQETPDAADLYPADMVSSQRARNLFAERTERERDAPSFPKCLDCSKPVVGRPRWCCISPQIIELG
jgi:hypothetical protein